MSSVVLLRRACAQPVLFIALQVTAAAAPGETPWEQPCKYELQVALERLVLTAYVDCSTAVAPSLKVLLRPVVM
jgi:hypothetical protein